MEKHGVRIILHVCPKCMQNKTRQILIADSLVIFVFDITDSYFLPGHIYTLSRGCAWQFITIALASAYTPLFTKRFVDSMTAFAEGGSSRILLAHIQFPLPAIHFLQYGVVLGILMCMICSARLCHLHA